jgi:micrococcal nuclease
MVMMLGVASTYFGVRAESVRRSVQKASAFVQTGDLVTYSSTVDGDTVVLANAVGDPVTVRVLGIKAFDSGSAKDPTANHGRIAVEKMRRALAEKPIRVMLGTPPKDKHGRNLATLFVDDEDIGLQMVREGIVLAYTQFPVPAMTEYLHAQEAAKNEHKGLWADPVAVDRAQLLMAEWRKGSAP